MHRQEVVQLAFGQLRSSHKSLGFGGPRGSNGRATATHTTRSEHRFPPPTPVLKVKPNLATFAENRGLLSRRPSTLRKKFGRYFNTFGSISRFFWPVLFPVGCLFLGYVTRGLDLCVAVILVMRICTFCVSDVCWSLGAFATCR